MEHRMTFGGISINSKDFQRFLKFAVVGVSGTLIDITIFTLLTKLAGLPSLPANTISYSVGVVNNFLLNRFWVYPEARSKSAAKQLAQFVVINIIALGLSDLLVVVLGSILSGLLGSSASIAAKLVATVLVFFWNFFANRLWTYRDVDQAPSQESTAA